MFCRIEDNKFVGFYEEKEKEGTFVEISVEDWNNLLNEQSEGETIFFNVNDNKIDTLKLDKKGRSIRIRIETHIYTSLIFFGNP